MLIGCPFVKSTIKTVKAVTFLTYFCYLCSVFETIVAFLLIFQTAIIFRGMAQRVFRSSDVLFNNALNKDI